MPKPRQLTFQNLRERSGRGGPRPGAGRPRGPRPVVHHVRREPVPKHVPCHVTLRVRRDVPSLRRRDFVRAFKRSLQAAGERGSFRLVHYSIQTDHVHMLVEAAGREAMGRGMKSIAARLARCANRVFRRRGPALLGRYHVRHLRTPREVRHALAYVLLNARKHWWQRRGSAPPIRLDEASSGRWFDGWKRGAGWRVDSRAHDPPREVAEPHTWLLRRGWRRHGLVDPVEVPGRAVRHAAGAT